MFGAADRDGGLGPDDLELLGTAAWWAGQSRRGHGGAGARVCRLRGCGPVERRRASGDGSSRIRRSAVGPISIGAGWLARAARLLESEPESALHADSLVFHALGALMEARIAEGIELADQAMELARKHDDRSAMFMAMSFKGMAQVFAGDWQAGLALIDEAATAASSGQLDLRVASDIYCNTIAACRNAGDYKRAGQWAEEGERWMHRQSVGGYPGICRVHRAELKMLRGLMVGSRAGGAPGVRGARAVRAPGCRRLRPLPGRRGPAAHGRPRGGCRGIRSGVRVRPRRPARPGAAAAGPWRGRRGGAVDRPRARRGRGKRRACRSSDPGPAAPRAGRHRARGRRPRDGGASGRRAGIDRRRVPAARVRGRRPHRAEANCSLERIGRRRRRRILGRSWRLWQETDLPYESARARLRYAEALAAEGDQEAARRDLRAARSAFERLGATLDLKRVDELLGSDGARRPRRAVERVDEDVHVHRHRHLDRPGRADRRRRLGRAPALARPRAPIRLRAAPRRGGQLDRRRVLRRLRAGDRCARVRGRHPAATGAAPPRARVRATVRIGLHTTEATREGRDYQGRGVHVAARIGAAAAGEEILVSEAAMVGIGSTGSGCQTRVSSPSRASKSRSRSAASTGGRRRGPG